jgi:hypothetical protein
VEVFGGLACGRHNITTEIPKTITKEPKRAASEALHATTNLQGVDNEGQGKFEEFEFPCEVIQWSWFSKFLSLLSLHSCLVPMISKLVLWPELVFAA